MEIRICKKPEIILSAWVSLESWRIHIALPISFSWWKSSGHFSISIQILCFGFELEIVRN